MKERIRLISALIVVIFTVTLLEIGAFSLRTNVHLYFFLLLQIALGFLVATFLVVVSGKRDNPENVIRPRPRRQRRYPWFEPPR